MWGIQQRVAEKDKEKIRAHAQEIIQSGRLGRSPLYEKLFSYLLEASLENRAPSETDIAIDVFDRDAGFDCAHDSVVRVYVHTLRSRLSEYYRQSETSDDWYVEIPKGGYRVTISYRPLAAVTRWAPWPRSSLGRFLIAGGVTAGFLMAFFAVLLMKMGDEQAESSAASTIRTSYFWRDIEKSDRPLTVLLGDLFYFSQRDEDTNRLRMVRDPTINSMDDFRQYLASDPSQAKTTGRYFMTFPPKGDVEALTSLVPIIYDGDRAITYKLVGDISNEAAAHAIEQEDVIYVGPLARLGPVAQPFFDISGFAFDRTSLTLTDKRSGKVYTYSSTLSPQQTDYGIVARFRGPSNNNIIIFSGGRSIGLLAAISAMTSKDGIAALKEKLAQSGGHPLPETFEALYTAHGILSVGSGSELVLARPLRPASPE